MSTSEVLYRTALAQISDITTRALPSAAPASAVRRRSGSRAGAGAAGLRDIGCYIKPVPPRLLVKAAQAAAHHNPLNVPAHWMLARLADLPIPPHIAVTVSKYWGPTPRQFSVSFMEDTDPALRARIVSHMNAWSDYSSLSFAETDGVGDVRVSLGPGGYWSYLGTDISLIPTDRQTMNLEAFSMDTDESEYHRVVRHEAGHTLGFPHEHLRAELVARIDHEKAYAYFLQGQNWDRAMVDAQVLTPLAADSIQGTPVDDMSIMCYQIPGSITIDGQPIRGGLDIDATDGTFAGQIYPPTGSAGPASSDDWGPENDV